MLIETAIKLIDNLMYFPGFEFEVVDHSKRFEGTVLLTIKYKAQDTNKEYAVNGYDKTIETYAKFPVMVGDINSDILLYRRIAQCLMKVYEHEMREALRVKGTFWAPFHPHAMDGIKTWHKTEHQNEVLNWDLQFGIA